MNGNCTMQHMHCDQTEVANVLHHRQKLIGLIGKCYLAILYAATGLERLTY